MAMDLPSETDCVVAKRLHAEKPAFATRRRPSSRFATAGVKNGARHALIQLPKQSSQLQMSHGACFPPSVKRRRALTRRELFFKFLDCTAAGTVGFGKGHIGKKASLLCGFNGRWK
jgi:hypothetical protein